MKTAGNPFNSTSTDRYRYDFVRNTRFDFTQSKQQKKTTTTTPKKKHHQQQRKHYM